MQTEASAVTPPAGRRRSLWWWVVGGAGALLGVAVLALAVNAVYWTMVGPPDGGGGGTLAEPTPLAFASLPAGTAAEGQRHFETVGCSACHSLVAEVKIVGPSLAGVGARAPGRKPDYAAEDYLLESIINPNAYIVKGFSRNVMPGTFQSQLSAQQLADLVAFLLTQ